MSFSEAYNGSASISTTEYSLVNNGTTLQSITTACIAQLFLDLSALTDVDIYELKIKEKVQSTGTQRSCHYELLSMVQLSAPNFATIPLILKNGWDFTLKRLAGADRTIGSSVRLVTGGTITELYAGSDTFTTTEESIAANTNATTAQSITTDGLYQGFLDLNALTDTEIFINRIKEKVQAGGTQRTLFYHEIAFGQGNRKIFYTPALQLMHGWDFTLQKDAGTDRAIPWSIHQVA